MDSHETRLRVVHLMEPAICLSCRFGAIADVEFEKDGGRRMFHCKRLDCDNWETDSEAGRPVQITELPDFDIRSLGM